MQDSKAYELLIHTLDQLDDKEKKDLEGYNFRVGVLRMLGRSIKHAYNKTEDDDGTPAMYYIDTTGTNTYVGTPTVAITTAYPKTFYYVNFNTTNTSSSSTLNISSLGAKAIKKRAGDGSLIVVETGDLVGEQVLVYLSEEDVFSLIGVSGGGSGDDEALLTETITAAGIGVIGAISDGDSFAENSDITLLLKALLVNEIMPSYTQPSLALSRSGNRYLKIGTTVTPTLSHVLSGDVGAFTFEELRRGGAQISLSMPYDDSLVVTDTTTSYQSYARYADGVLKQTNLGNDDVDNQILANEAPAALLSSDIEYITGVYPIYFGTAATLIEIDAIKSDVYGAAINNENIDNFEGQDEYEAVYTGGSPVYLWIAIPERTPLKTNWRDSNDANNASTIGGVNDLFGPPSTITISSTGLSVDWGINYRFYVTTYRTLPFTVTFI